MNIGNDIIVRIFSENPINEISGKYYLTFRYDDIYGNEYDLTALENEQKNDKKLEYHPKDYFGDDFATTMSEFANSILKECCYSGLVQAHFNFNTFDIEVNGEDKGTSHGKGYHSYLNTVMIMMLRKCLAANAKFDPHVFIVDTISAVLTMAWMTRCPIV